MCLVEPLQWIQIAHCYQFNRVGGKLLLPKLIRGFVTFNNVSQVTDKDLWPQL